MVVKKSPQYCQSQSIIDAFEERFIPEPNTGCWLWIGNSFPSRYGYGAFTKRTSGINLARAHRVAWRLYKGPIPEGLHVLHSCDMPSCVNPDHLWLGTQASNMRDKALKGRQRAGWDHPGVKHGRYIGDKQNPEYHR